MRDHPAVRKGLAAAGMHRPPTENNFRTAPARQPVPRQPVPVSR